jgi:tRNA(Ile2) C34 agmatinyltransferase TiaS
MKIINGKHILTEDDIRIRNDDIEVELNGFACEDWLGTINVIAYVETWFDVDDRFGTETYDTDDCINVYIYYAPHTENIKMIYIIKYADGSDSKDIDVELHQEEVDMFVRELKKSGVDEIIQEFKEYCDDD